MQAPRAVLFDVDGVMIHGYHVKPELRRCWDEHLERDLGIPRDIFKEKFIFDVFIRDVVPGKISLHDALAAALPAMGFDMPPQTVIDYWLEKDSHINHDLLAVVKRIKESGTAKLYLATNQEHNRAAYLMDTLGFAAYFDDIFHSARMGAGKPDPAYYSGVSALLGPQAAPPVFFDDTPAAVEAARAHGWEAYVFNDISDLQQNAFMRPFLIPS